MHHANMMFHQHMYHQQYVAHQYMMQQGQPPYIPPYPGMHDPSKEFEQSHVNTINTVQNEVVEQSSPKRQRMEAPSESISLDEPSRMGPSPIGNVQIDTSQQEDPIGIALLDSSGIEQIETADIQGKLLV